MEKLRRAISPSKRGSRHKRPESSTSVVSNITPANAASTKVATIPNQQPVINNSQVAVVVAPMYEILLSLGSCVILFQVLTCNSFDPDPAFIAALKAHEEKLSESEMAAFQSAKAGSPQGLIQKVQSLDEEHKSSSISRPLAPRIGKILNGMTQFMGSIGTLIQYSGQISALVVGGVMCIVKVSFND